MEEHECDIGELGYEGEGIIVSLPSLIKMAKTDLEHVKSKKAITSSQQRALAETNGMSFIYGCLDRFGYCPRCGKKLDWMSMVENFRKCCR